MYCSSCSELHLPSPDTFESDAKRQPPNVYCQMPFYTGAVVRRETKEINKKENRETNNVCVGTDRIL